MIVQRGFEQLKAGQGGYLSIGNFDGVHRGHQRILGTLVEQAHAVNAPAVVMTFDPHPIVLLAPHRAPPNLSTLERKSELIAKCGVDMLLVVKTTPELLRLSPRDFFERIIREQLKARGMVEGPNFFFGRDRAGDVKTLRSFCEGEGLSLTVVEPVGQSGAIVSSSAIRKAIGAGRVREAVEMLGHPYQISGCVVEGAGRGRQIGFPTANLTGISTLLPANGVYAGLVRRDGEIIPAAVHVGPNPTFGEQSHKVEVHLIGHDEQLYGQSLAVELLSEVRETRTFASREELVAQVEADVAGIRDVFASYVAGGG